MKNLIRTIAIFTIISFAFTSCKDEEKNPSKPSDPSNPTEIITTAQLILIEEASGSMVTASWKDADGDGPGQPVVTGLALEAGKVYHGTVLLLDESKSPVDTISHEVEEEKDEHQFFYTVSGNASGRIQVEKMDKDNNNLPVGLEVHVTTTAGPAVEGTLKVVLKHYDGVDKSADPAVGETDIEIELPVSVQ